MYMKVYMKMYMKMYMQMYIYIYIIYKADDPVPSDDSIDHFCDSDALRMRSAVVPRRAAYSTKWSRRIELNRWNEWSSDTGEWPQARNTITTSK